MNTEQMHLAYSFFHIIFLSPLLLCWGAPLLQSISWLRYLFQNQSLAKLLKLAFCSWCCFALSCCLNSFCFLLMGLHFLHFLYSYPPWQVPRPLQLSSIPPCQNLLLERMENFCNIMRTWLMQHKGPPKQGTQPLADEMKYYHWMFRHLLVENEFGGRGRVENFHSFLL